MFVEPLEVRRMMAVDVGLDDGVLRVDGTLGADEIRVLPSGSNICVNTDSDSAYEACYASSLVWNRIEVWADWGDDFVNVYNTLEIDALIVGGRGNDTLGGGGGDDTIIGEFGSDKIDGDDGNDLLVGDYPWSGASGNDTLEGDAGNDTLYGGSGKDELHGDTGDDELHGESGDDHLYGGDDNDTLYGGDGADYLKGGDGGDTLHYDSDDWYVVVT